MKHVCLAFPQDFDVHGDSCRTDRLVWCFVVSGELRYSATVPGLAVRVVRVTGVENLGPMRSPRRVLR